MAHVLLTFMVLLGASSLAVAGDFEDGVAAYRAEDYATAFAKLQRAATAPSPHDAAAEGPTPPTLDEFLAAARPMNPTNSDEDLTKYWRRVYGPQDDNRPLAQVMLGLMYAHGRGVAQDYAQAVTWYRKAAEQGLALAQAALGARYADGRGVPQDYVLAHMWVNLAAAQEAERGDAVELRDTITSRMTAAQLAEAQKLAREWKPTASPGSPSPRDPGTRRDPAPAAASGTGFVVSHQGYVLTNYHVIEECLFLRAIMAGREYPVTEVGTDVENDLALLQLPAPLTPVARFREGRGIRPGDGVVIVGFPLHGLLASEAQVTTGTVSALAGIGNDARFLQMTAPVQPGNSGGPLLDQGSNIVGVVVSKLDAIEIAGATGDIPQNINFAINAAIAKAFLDANSVEYETAATAKGLGPAEIAAKAKQFTLLLECYR